MNNPYSWNTVNPSLFFGRELLKADLLTQLPGSPRHSFGVAGGRRMGKTTLLRRVEKELLEGVEQWKEGGLWVIPIYVDGHVLPRPLTYDSLWRYLLRRVSEALPGVELPEFTHFEGLRRALGEALPNLEERPRLIFFFDEIELIVAADWGQEFFDNWRALLSNSPGVDEYITTIFTGAQEVKVLAHDLTSPLADVLDLHSLRLFDFEDSCRLIQEPIDRKWSETFLKSAYQETGGHPMLLQYLMQHVCTRPDDAEAALAEASVRFAANQSHQFRKWWTHYCSVKAQRVYSRLPDDGGIIQLSDLYREFGDEVNDALDILQHVGITVAEDDGFAFRYAGEMFRRWYRVYGTLSDSPQHDPEIYRRLAALDQAIAGKYVSAWGNFQQTKPNYSGVLAELRGVLEVLLDEQAARKEVMSAPGFELENGQTQPTLRQRVNFLAKKLHYNKDQSQEILHDFNMAEVEREKMDLLAPLATSAHRTASGMVHGFANREQAYRALKQWDSILAQLLPRPN